MTRTNNVDQSVCQSLKYFSANGVQMLATVQANTAVNGVQIARVFQIPAAISGTFPSVLSSNIPSVTGSQNGNGLGAVDVQKGYLVFGAPGNGLSFFNWVSSPTHRHPSRPALRLRPSLPALGQLSPPRRPARRP
ncbi:MAG: hypothetical protein WDN00_17185 [Limisphaerales bacterium]